MLRFRTQYHVEVNITSTANVLHKTETNFLRVAFKLVKPTDKT